MEPRLPLSLWNFQHQILLFHRLLFHLVSTEDREWSFFGDSQPFLLAFTLIWYILIIILGFLGRFCLLNCEIYGSCYLIYPYNCMKGFHSYIDFVLVFCYLVGCFWDGSFEGCHNPQGSSMAMICNSSTTFLSK